MAIKVTNLPFELSDDAIEAELEKLFAPYGTVAFYRSIEIGENGDDKVAYIRLEDEAAEERAIDKLNKLTTDVFTKPIRLGITRPNIGGGQ